jgi:hypothetical protein
LTVYLRQPQFTFIGDAPNLWAFPGALGVSGPTVFPIGYALGALGSLYVILLRKRNPLDWALLSALLIPFLLPKMLERFFFLADVLSLGIACVRRDRASITLAVAIQVGSFLSIAAYLDNIRWLNAVACLPMAASVSWVLCRSFKAPDIGSAKMQPA